MKKYSLYQLQVYLQRVITLNFQEPIWVTAEISKAKTTRGHTFLELVEKRAGDDEIAAQGRAALWSKHAAEIESRLSIPLEDLLREGTEVSIQVEVTYHTVHGLGLSVTDIDVEYTLGRMEMHRQETINRLKKEDLFERNTLLPLPPVIQRIAVISSSSAAGYQDFIHHLDQNRYGYDFQIDLYPCAMQGSQLESELQSSLDQINAYADDYDAAVIIRGGGSRLDLGGFDSYAVARAISLTKIPVLTGIGHETDTTISDLVANRNFRTPTAVAGFLVEHQLVFEQKVVEWSQRIKELAFTELLLHKEQIEGIWDHIQRLSNRLIADARSDLQTSRAFRQSHIRSRLHSERLGLAHQREKIQLLDPRTLLQKGYTFTMKDGQRIYDIGQLVVGDSIETIFVDGQVKSTIKNIQ